MQAYEQTTQTTTIGPKRKSFFKKYGAVLLIALVIVLALTSAYFYKKSRSLNTTDQASQAEVKSLIEKVSRILVVPTDETPTVATVSDPEALKDQPFFAGAKKGDKVLIYSNAKKAVLYDPVADKIITVAPLNTESAAGTTPVVNQQKQ